MYDLITDFSFEAARQAWRKTRYNSIPADKKPSHFQEVLRSGETKPLTPAERQKFKELTTLKIKDKT